MFALRRVRRRLARRYVEKAVALRQANALSAAEAATRRALRLSPDAPWFLLEAAEVDVSQGNLQAASAKLACTADSLAEGLASRNPLLIPHIVEICNKAAAHAKQVGAIQMEEQVLSTVLRVLPGEVGALRRLAQLAFDRKDYVMASTRWKELVHTARLRGDLADLELSMKELNVSRLAWAARCVAEEAPQEADRTLAAILRDEPRNVHALRARARLAEDRGDWAGAIEYWAAVVRFLPCSHRKERAIRSFSRAVRKYAQMKLQGGEVSGPEALLQKYQTEFPENVTLLTDLAAFAIARSEWELGIERLHTMFAAAERQNIEPPARSRRMLAKCASKLLPKTRTELQRRLLPPETRVLRRVFQAADDSHFEHKALLSAIKKPHYGYGIYQAAKLAQALSIPKISLLEFGVAGGNGLVAMEEHSEAVKALTGIEMEVFGFDTGQGLPVPHDYRDMPYMFAPGNYRMDIEKLKARLKHATLVLGDVTETAPTFLAKYEPAPIGFISFDMDYYSATAQALAAFSSRVDDRYFLPRVFMHFDDINGNEVSLYNDYVGELAAIKDFNALSRAVKISRNRTFNALNIRFSWYSQSYIMHRFAHNRYPSYVSSATPETLSLKDDPSS